MIFSKLSQSGVQIRGLINLNIYGKNNIFFQGLFIQYIHICIRYYWEKETDS